MWCTTESRIKGFKQSTKLPQGCNSNFVNLTQRASWVYHPLETSFFFMRRKMTSWCLNLGRFSHNQMSQTSDTIKSRQVKAGEKCKTKQYLAADMKPEEKGLISRRYSMWDFWKKLWVDYHVGIIYLSKSDRWIISSCNFHELFVFFARHH